MNGANVKAYSLAKDGSKQIAAYAEKLLPNRGGIGIYGTFTHIDGRAVKSRWNG